MGSRLRCDALAILPGTIGPRTCNGRTLEQAPALLRSSFGVSPQDIQAYVLDSRDSLPVELQQLGITTRVLGTGPEQQTALTEELVRAGHPTFVCTPSSSHHTYYAALAQRSIRCAVEKSLSNVAQEIPSYATESVGVAGGCAP